METPCPRGVPSPVLEREGRNDHCRASGSLAISETVGLGPMALRPTVARGLPLSVAPTFVGYRRGEAAREGVALSLTPRPRRDYLDSLAE